MRIDLANDPSVIMMATVLGISEDEIVGKLHRLWSWADCHTSDGFAPAITKTWTDRYVGKSGFADAMVQAGWLKYTEKGILFPGFERHNGDSAKKRAEDTLRQRLSRRVRGSGQGIRVSIPRPFIRIVMERDGYRCVYCGMQSDAAFELTRKKLLSVDHIHPASRGGKQSVDCLATCCKPCNMEKNDRTPEEWGIIPTFLQPGTRYENGHIIVASLSQILCDKSVTREEKRREEKKIPTPLPPPREVEPGNDAESVCVSEEPHTLTRRRVNLETALILPPIVLEAMRAFTPEIQYQAWEVVQAFCRYSPKNRSTQLLGEMAATFADSLVHRPGAKARLMGYFSASDPRQIEQEFADGKRLRPMASPYEICDFLFRSDDTPAREPDTSSVVALERQKRLAASAPLTAEQQEQLDRLREKRRATA